ncbi:hypothetical protein EPA93_01395 [Ktedonosporobacter rubrisoli]|uniref:Tetratricopeptide repeat protein n=1 Tax=Ktedonosporobacter rubrisoli TaxID=2509675 RepID=A0A4P6JI36_KTERU|nr:hypothetical protein [Ktedonosporobacter rubrisoli]QBD74715.1 hypothetical protein EPA93_01395 [Ktedonosporobacter rubrisoli]
MSLSVEAITERYIIGQRALSEIAQAYFFEGRLEEALSLFQAGEHLLEARELSPESRLDWLLEYGLFVVHYYYLTGMQKDLMASVLQRARQAAEASQQETKIATAFYLVGQASYYQNLLSGGTDYSAARDMLQKASQLYEKHGDNYKLAEALFYTGLTYDRQQQDERSREHYLRALALGEQYGNKWAASEAMRHLTDYSDGEQRLHYALGSLTLREELGSKVYVPSAQLLLSDIYIERGELEKALEYCQQAERLNKEMELEARLIGVLVVKGEIAYKQDRLAEARERWEQAFSLSQKYKAAHWLPIIEEKLKLLADGAQS